MKRQLIKLFPTIWLSQLGSQRQLVNVPLVPRVDFVACPKCGLADSSCCADPETVTDHERFLCILHWVWFCLHWLTVFYWFLLFAYWGVEKQRFRPQLIDLSGWRNSGLHAEVSLWHASVLRASGSEWLRTEHNRLIICYESAKQCFCPALWYMLVWF